MIHPKEIYTQGMTAKQNGNDRISPYTYRIGEGYWYAGYDGEDFNSFHKFVRAELKQIKSSLGYSRIGLNNI